MNEYQMIHLAAARRRDLLDEADRARLARLVRPARAGRSTDPPRRQRRSRRILGLDLRSLLGRPI
jgi:hypothetical protein